MSLLDLEHARARLLERVRPLSAETVELEEAAGRVLAEPVRAYRDQPPAPLSAMDGYAVRNKDLKSGRFRLTGESAAGAPFTGGLGAGEAVRISTGAVAPEGADRVVMQEHVRRDGSSIQLERNPGDSRFIRSAGLDFKAGETVLEAGARLGAAQIALAAAANQNRLTVHGRPRVALVSTGDELVAPGGTPASDQIVDAASYGVAAALRRWGAGRIERFHWADDLDAATQAARAMIDAFDLIVTVGGASVGDHDVVRDALAAAGADLSFAGVAVRPGKPFWHARAGAVLIAGLPGNPASALVAARLLLAPVLGRLTGRGEADFTRTHTAALEKDAAGPGRRETWHRALLAHGSVRLDPREDSSLLTPLAAADILVRQPAGQPLSAGSRVEWLPVVEPLDGWTLPARD